MSETQTPSNEDFLRDFIDLQRKVQDISNSAVSGNQLATGDIIGNFAATRSGCLLCDGSILLDADQPALATYIRTYLAALIIDGVSVHLPDYRGCVPAGANGASFVLGTPTGAEAITLTATQSGIAAHTHPGGGAGTTGAGSAHNHTINAEASHTHTFTSGIQSASHSHQIGRNVIGGVAGGDLGAAGGYNETTSTTTTESANHTHSGTTAAGASHTHTSVNESAHTHSFTDPTTGAATATPAAASHSNVQPTLPTNWFIKT